MHKDTSFALMMGVMLLMFIAAIVPGLGMFKPNFLRTYKLWKILLFVFFAFMISILIKG